MPKVTEQDSGRTCGRKMLSGVFIFIAGSLGLQGDPRRSLEAGQNVASLAKAGLWGGSAARCM